MLKILVIVSAVLFHGASLMACVTQPIAQQPTPVGDGRNAAGTYSGFIDGQSYVLTLMPDGSASVNGQPGRWHLEGANIVLSDGQQSVYASPAGDQLWVYLPTGVVSFVRSAPAAYAPAPVAAGPIATQAAAGAAPTSVPHSAAKEFSPSNTLAGDVIAPELASAEFTVPDGWSHGPKRDHQGVEQYTLTPQDGVGGIVLSRRLLAPGEAVQPPSSLLARVIAELTAGQAVRQVLPPEGILIASQPGARAIVRGSVGGADLELYVAGVIAHGHGYVIAGMYPAARAEAVRPAFDTVLVTFRAMAPKENAALRSQILGCWEDYEGNTDRSGSTSSSRRIGLNGDSTYWYRSRMYINAEGAGSMSSKNGEQGRFRVEGNTVITTSDQGEVSSYQVALQGGRLYVDGAKFLRCRQN